MSENEDTLLKSKVSNEVVRTIHASPAMYTDIVYTATDRNRQVVRLTFAETTQGDQNNINVVAAVVLCSQDLASVIKLLQDASDKLSKPPETVLQ